jgi:hypothetical protein
MTNTAAPAPTTNLEVPMFHTNNTKEATVVTNNDVQMGATVVIRGAEYTIVDEPRYVRAYGGHQMVEWDIRPVPAGLKTGLLSGKFQVWPNEEAAVVG